MTKVITKDAPAQTAVPKALDYSAEREIAELKAEALVADEELSQLRARVLDLTLCVTDCDDMSASTLAQVMSQMKLLMAFLERPEAKDNLEVLADTLEQTLRTAESCQSYLADRVRQEGFDPQSEVRWKQRLLATLKQKPLSPL